MPLSMRNRKKQLLETLRGFKTDSPLTVASDVAFRVFEALDTPISLSCSLLMKYGEWAQLAGKAVLPANYLDTDAERFADDYQAVSFLRKYPGLPTGVDLEKAAWEKFQEAEVMCHHTNARLKACRSSGVYPSGIGGILFSASEKIYDWLKRLTAEEWAVNCRFGPGSDDLSKGRRISVWNKMHHGFSSTADFRDGASGLVQCHPRWAQSFLGEDWEHGAPCTILGKVAPGNKVAFVPKTALTHRSIAVEPQMNIFAQLGLGGLMRGRLKSIGLDLDEQAPNQEYAYLGSVDGHLATIDLQSASDSVSVELVRELLPSAWFMALDLCRSKVGSYQDETFWYEKFSSMGNGFTFELESMIFYALSLSVCEELATPNKKYIRAYGDDIVVPVQAYERLVEVLEFVGFTVNKKKSYSSGVFRESCGHDYFNGKLVRPFFLKEEIQSVEGLYRLANGLRRYAFRRGLGYYCDRRFKRPWLSAYSRIPNSLRGLWAPGRAVRRYDLSPARVGDVESGDGGLLLNLDEITSSPFHSKAKDGWEGWTFLALTASVRTHGHEGSAWFKSLAYALYVSRDGLPDIALGDDIPLRGESGRRLTVQYAPSYQDCGPWA